MDLEKIDFSFDYIQVKLMDNEVRLKIQEELAEIPARVEKEYFGRLQRVHMITELYYGKIHLKTNRETAHHLDTLVKNSSIKGVVKLHKDKTWHYIFDHHDVPFAMRIEPIDEFKA